MSGSDVGHAATSLGPPPRPATVGFPRADHQVDMCVGICLGAQYAVSGSTIAFGGSWLLAHCVWLAGNGTKIAYGGRCAVLRQRMAAYGRAMLCTEGAHGCVWGGGKRD